MKKVKIAQIGTSRYSHGNQMWDCLLSLGDVFEVVGYAFPENERERFPEKMKIFDPSLEMTVDEILNDPEIEAVIVETEEIYLTKYALMAARAGKHIHMEKPGGQNPEEFEAVVEELRKRNLVFSVGYMYRFNPKIAETIERAKRGELGKIYSVEAQMSCTHTKEMKEWLCSFEGGMTFFLGCHLIDIIFRLQGYPEEIIPLSTSTGIDGVDSKDFGMVVFKYKNGASFIKTSASECGGFLRRQLVICAEDATVEIKPLEIAEGVYQYNISNESRSKGAPAKAWHQPWASEKSELTHRYAPMLENFAELVRGKENPFTYDYELELYKLILKCCKRG